MTNKEPLNPPPSKPDWVYWSSVPYVEIYDGIWLTFDIDPRDAAAFYNRNKGSPITREFIRRTKLLVAAIKGNGAQDAALSFVKLINGRWVAELAGLAQWADLFRWPLPAEYPRTPRMRISRPDIDESSEKLVAANDGAVSPLTARSKGNGATTLTWQATARLIGAEIAAKSPRLSVEQIAEKVRLEMLRRQANGEPGMAGRGGRVPNSETIKRHALTGIKA